MMSRCGKGIFGKVRGISMQCCLGGGGRRALHRRGGIGMGKISEGHIVFWSTSIFATGRG